MIVTTPTNPANTGPDGIQLAAAAEKLESVLWQDVLSSMTKSAISGSSLGTGSTVYNGIATQALSTSMFGKTDSSLTQEIVDQLKTRLHSAGATPAVPSTSAVLAALPQVQAALTTTADPSVLGRAESYAKAIWPKIKAGAASLDAPPVALLAQSALETGWGASTPGGNLFGIKAVASQSGNVEPTQEDIGGKMLATSASFASYSSSAASISHYVGLIRNSYHGAVGSASVAEYANALAQGGYATDPNYAQEIVSIAQSPIMRSVLQTIEGANP